MYIRFSKYHHFLYCGRMVVEISLTVRNPSVHQGLKIPPFSTTIFFCIVVGKFSHKKYPLRNLTDILSFTSLFVTTLCNLLVRLDDIVSPYHGFQRHADSSNLLNHIPQSAVLLYPSDFLYNTFSIYLHK